jgi:RHS repeat-associated protein
VTDPDANGFQTINDYVLGPGGEQVTEMGMDPNSGALAWKHTNVYAAGALIATYDGGNEINNELVNTGGALSESSTAAAHTYALHFYFNDPLGTRRAQTDYAGVLEQSCASLPFGDGLNCTGSTTTPTEHHFTGKERDTESGNDYFEARYYSSAMGRFMSPDWSAKTEPVPYAKLDNPQSLNLYAYVYNNPLTGIDADGHESTEEWMEKHAPIVAERMAEEKWSWGGAEGPSAELQGAANKAMAQQQITTAKGTSVWQGIKNLAHLRGWNNNGLQGTVTTTETYTVPALAGAGLAPMASGAAQAMAQAARGIPSVSAPPTLIPTVMPPTAMPPPTPMQQLLKIAGEALTNSAEGADVFLRDFIPPMYIDQKVLHPYGGGCPTPDCSI